MLIDGTRIDDVRVYESPVQTLKERMGTGGNNVPILAFDTKFGSNANVFQNQSPTLKSTQSGPSVALGSTMAVRRLTPLECERLMGWPDDHTRYKADGTEQADTHRYKQCGNGVASPVAQWIGEQLRNL
jgi:DNA (cytosine-5)-methyltransferase 1